MLRRWIDFILREHGCCGCSLSGLGRREAPAPLVMDLFMALSSALQKLCLEFLPVSATASNLEPRFTKSSRDTVVIIPKSRSSISWIHSYLDSSMPGSFKVPWLILIALSPLHVCGDRSDLDERALLFKADTILCLLAIEAVGSWSEMEMRGPCWQRHVPMVYDVESFSCCRT